MGQVNGGTGVIVRYFIIGTIPGVRPDEDDANTRDHYTMDGAKEKSKQGNILIDR